MQTAGEDLTTTSPQPPRCESLACAKSLDRIIYNKETSNSYSKLGTEGWNPAG